MDQLQIIITPLATAVVYASIHLITQTDWTDENVGPSMNEDHNITDKSVEQDNQYSVARNGHIMDMYEELSYSDIKDTIVRLCTDDCIESNNWVADSVTTSHICNMRTTFMQYAPDQKKVSVCGVRGIVTHAEG
jgi:urocanate hydratase